MYRVMIWGTGKGYSRYYNLLKYYELINEISIVGVFSNDKEIQSTIDGYPFYAKEEVSARSFSYCIVTIDNMDLIVDEAASLGITRDRLIPARVLSIPHFNFDKYAHIKTSGLSIVSRNCWAGICYHYLALEFQSPTINLFFQDTEFNRFIEKIDYYLSIPLEFVEMKYETRLEHEYPVCRLDDITICFNHYTSFENAVESWERRKMRMVENRLYISSTENKEAAIRFTQLPVENKLIFVPKEMDIDHESVLKLNYQNMNDGNTIGMYSNFTANGKLNVIDLLSLCCKENYKRCDTQEA